MKKNFSMKTLTIALSLIMVAGLFAGCGASKATTATQKKRIKIGVDVYYMSEFITLMKEGVVSEAKAQGADIVFLDANNDINTQISQVQNLITQKCDVLLIASVDPNGIAPAVAAAKKANIPVVGVNMIINSKDTTAYVGPNDVQAGEEEMQAAIDKIGGKGNIVILQGPIGISAQIQRDEGNHNILKKYPNVKLLSEQTANWNRNEALKLTENWLQSNPGKINAIVAHNDEMALGAIAALKEKGLLSKVVVTGIDAINDGCKAVKNGELTATVYQNANFEGSEGVKAAILAAKHETIAKKNNLIDMKVINKANVDDLLSTIYKAK